MNLGEQELRLQIAHRRTETTVPFGAEWHEATYGRAATTSLSQNRTGLPGVLSLGPLKNTQQERTFRDPGRTYERDHLVTPCPFKIEDPGNVGRSKD